MRLVFMGSPPFAGPVLEKVLASRHATLALVTPPDKPRGRGRKIEASPLVDLARAREMAVIQPATTRDPELVAALRKLAPDVLLVASYGEILRREVLELAPHGAFNVHASLLPRHRGASPIQAAILAGDEETGISIQRMVLALDEGDVLLAIKTKIGARENAGELLERLAPLGGEAAVRALDLLENGEARFTPQDPRLATYARKITKEHGILDWAQSAAAIERRVRAMTPWPGARTSARVAGGATDEAESVEIVLLDVLAIDASATCANATPGSILEVKKSFTVAAGQGAIEIRTLKPAGKGRMDGIAWLRGARLERGARLGA